MPRQTSISNRWWKTWVAKVVQNSQPSTKLQNPNTNPNQRNNKRNNHKQPMLNLKTKEIKPISIKSSNKLWVFMNKPYKSTWMSHFIIIIRRLFTFNLSNMIRLWNRLQELKPCLLKAKLRIMLKKLKF